MRNAICLAALAGLGATLACDSAPDTPQVPTFEPSRPDTSSRLEPEPEPEPAPAPAPAPAPIPTSGPVVAHIDGERVEGFKGWYMNGVLTLYTGDDPNFEYGQKIGFWHVPREPAGQRIRHPAPEGSMQFGKMTYDKHDPTVNLSTQWLEGYTYDLQIGHEQDFQVEVTLQGRAESPVRIEVSGTVTAMTAGIKMADGVVDRSFDHIDTIQWLTRAWIEERHRPQAIARRPDHCMMETAPKREPSKPHRQVAACSYLYTDAAGDSAIAKLWFEKQDDRWTEVRELEPGQLFRANPIKPTRDQPPWALGPIAAQRFQDTVYANRGGFKRVTDPGLFPCGGGRRERQPGWCEITYAVHPKDRTPGEKEEPFCQVVTYVFAREADGQWEIAKTLSTAQKLNRKTGQVESRDEVPQHCG